MRCAFHPASFRRAGNLQARLLVRLFGGLVQHVRRIVESCEESLEIGFGTLEIWNAMGAARRADGREVAISTPNPLRLRRRSCKGFAR